MIKLKKGDTLEAGHFLPNEISPYDIYEGVFVRITPNDEVWLVVKTEGEERFTLEISNILTAAGWVKHNTEVRSE